MEGLVGTNRGRVVREIVESERTYNNDLHVLLQVYVLPLRKRNAATTAAPKIQSDNVPKLDIQEINTLFCNVEAILNVSEQVLKEFEADLTSFPNQVGQIFLKLAPTLKLYLAFATSVRSAIDKHKHLLETNSSYKAFCEICAARDESERGDLQSYLILGIQRVPRYRLLLKALIENTEDSNPDKGNLLEAYEEISKVTATINDGVENHERREEVLNIQNKFVGCGEIVKPHRVFIREGDLKKCCKRKTKRFRFVLFNDALIYGEAVKSETFKFHRLIELRSTKVAPLKDDLQFLIASPCKSFRVMATSREERDSWVKSAEEAIDVCQKNLVPLPPMKRDDGSSTSLRGRMKSRRSNLIRFSSSNENNSDGVSKYKEQGNKETNCNVCDVEFKRQTRKQYCRRCQVTVCDSCSPNRWMLPHISMTKLQRVCQPCYNQLFIGVYDVKKQKQSSASDIPINTSSYNSMNTLPSSQSGSPRGSSFNSSSSSEDQEAVQVWAEQTAWEEVHTDDGEVYYWNVITNEVTWDKPTRDVRLWQPLETDSVDEDVVEEKETMPIVSPVEVPIATILDSKCVAETPPPIPKRPSYQASRRTIESLSPKKRSSKTLSKVASPKVNRRSKPKNYFSRDILTAINASANDSCSHQLVNQNTYPSVKKPQNMAVKPSMMFFEELIQHVENETEEKHQNNIIKYGKVTAQPVLNEVDPKHREMNLDDGVFRNFFNFNNVEARRTEAN